MFSRRRIRSAGLPIALSLVALLCPGPDTCRAAGTLYFTDVFNPSFSDGFISRVNTDGTGLAQILSLGGGLRGIALDQVAGKMYWSDVDHDLILRANLDGSEIDTLVTDGLLFPFGVALDHGLDLLAWGDQSLQVVKTAHLDGSGVQTIVSTPFASGIALDATNGKVYWTTAITATEGEILRANLDGTGVETVVTGVDRPSQIALDLAGGKVYWTDYVIDVVRRANLDGTGVEDLYLAGGNLNPDGITLDLTAGKVYWGQSVETNRESIMAMNLDGTSPEVVATGFGIVASIAFQTAPVGAPEGADRAPTGLAAAPNPSAGAVTIGFDLAEPAKVAIVVYTVAGRLVRSLRPGLLPVGRHEIAWDGTDETGRPVPNGIYFGRLETRTGGGTVRVILIR